MIGFGPAHSRVGPQIAYSHQTAGFAIADPGGALTDLIAAAKACGCSDSQVLQSAAQAMGINTTKYKVIAFVTGAFFAGMAGGLYAHFISYITPQQSGFIKPIEIVVMVIVVFDSSGY